MVKKIVLFKENLQTIEKLIAQGYTHKEIHLKLLNEHGLHIAYKTYDKYYYQLRKTINLNEVELKTTSVNETGTTSVNEYERPKFKSTLTRLNEDADKMMGIKENTGFKIDKLF